MRVLFINTVFGRGSTGNIVRALGEALEQQGHEYKALYGRPPVSDDPHAVYIGSAWDTYVHAALSRLTDRSAFYSKRATAQTIRFIREYAPDVIHLHNLHGYYLNIEMLFHYLKTEYTGKVVWTLHDCWAYTGHCTHYTYAGCDRWKTACHHCPQKHDYPQSVLVDSSAKNHREKKEIFSHVPNMTIVTVSEWLKEQAKQSFLGQYPIVRIYNGIDIERFRPSEDVSMYCSLEENTKTVLLVSDGWTTRKGYDYALKVAAAAPKDWRFVMVGLNKSQIEKLPKNILGIERIWDQTELIKLYSSVDIFFNPSVEETFGLVTAEAMCCGTPAVVFDQTACPELITTNQNGTVVPLGTSAENMLTILREAMLKTVDRSALTVFSTTQFLQNHLALYSTLQKSDFAAQQ